MINNQAKLDNNSGFISPPNSREIGIIPRNKEKTEWAVKIASDRIALATFPTMEDAIKKAKSIKLKDKKIILFRGIGDYEYL